MADAFDPHTIGEAAEMSCRSLIERAHKVTPLVRDRQARA
jgi:hypothetical protein